MDLVVLLAQPVVVGSQIKVVVAFVQQTKLKFYKLIIVSQLKDPCLHRLNKF